MLTIATVPSALQGHSASGRCAVRASIPLPSGSARSVASLTPSSAAPLTEIAGREGGASPSASGRPVTIRDRDVEEACVARQPLASRRGSATY